MLRLIFDVYSGRPNPDAMILDEVEAASTLKELSKDRAEFSDSAPADAGLGFRGIAVEALTDDVSTHTDMPTSFYVSAAAAAKSSRISEHLERLIGLAQRGVTDSQDDMSALYTALSDRLTRSGRDTVADSAGPAVEAPKPDDSPMDVTCTIELGTFNPGFWNNDASVRTSNNCYNYASNKRTNTFAQPGKGCGHMYTAITCPEVTRAALCDGLHRRFDCFPDNEKPRWLMALVVAPGPGFIDYHWYRKSKEGFWGHKPGGTAARNTDNSNRVIMNPETCDRGPYTRFCGYFYSCKSQKIR